MPINQLICEDPSESPQRFFKSSLVSLSVMNKSKIDKAQARRLKMPKRNRSAYFLFSMDIRAKLKAESNNQLTPLETQSLVSKYWKDLSCEEKEKYEQKAKEEKLEYLVAMDKFYSNLTPETIEKSKTNKPKKPCSAYAHFVRDIKTNLKKENPRLIMQEILHIASDKWKNLDEKIRVVYEEKARKDKEQYMAITRNLNSESNENSKKRKGSQESTKFGKRNFKVESSNEEKQLTKQVKVENISVKSETPIEFEESSYTPIKLEEYKEVSNLSLSPMNRIDTESQQMIEKLRYRNESNMIHMNMNPWNERQNIFEMSQYNTDFVHNTLPMGQYMFNVQNDQQIQQAMAAKISLVRMVQNQQSLEQTIMRKMMEIKTLHAQRMMANREFFLATTNVGF